MKKTSNRAQRVVNPHNASSGKADGWFYENAKSIDVYLRDVNSGVTVSCRIRRGVLADWIKRTEPAP